MDQNTKDILATVNFIKDNMVTKDDLREELAPAHSRLSNIEAELRDISGRLDMLEEAVSSMKGYAKEIDDLRGRVREIEKHLGIAKNMAA
jgi:predicted nuclease with TOPRIM domain